MIGTRGSYDLVAERYADELGDELRGKPLDRGMLGVFAELTDGGVVADIGCGPGHVAAYLAGRGCGLLGWIFRLRCVRWRGGLMRWRLVRRI